MKKYLISPNQKKRVREARAYMVANLFCVRLNGSHQRLVSAPASSLLLCVTLVEVNEEKPKTVGSPAEILGIPRVPSSHSEDH